MSSAKYLCMAALLGLAASQLLTPGSPQLKPSSPFYSAKNLKSNLKGDVDINGVKGKSGFVKINEESGSSMFYWFIQQLKGDVTKDDVPLILWLQGGPGCSSQTGNLFEFGPLYIDKDLNPQLREVNWASDYHLLFIDNPLGAGYSYAAKDEDYVVNYTQMAENLYKMLQSLNGLYPEWFKRDFYIFGESYAGHWIPAIAHKILAENKQASVTKNAVIPLKGIGIGDGWTDPYYQLSHNANFAYSWGLVSEKEKEQVASYEREGRDLISKNSRCEALGKFDAVMDTITKAGGDLNVYNIREFGSYDTSFMENWLNLDATKDLLNVPHEIEFTSCDGTAYEKLCDDFMNTVKPLFPSILSEIPVLLFNGQDDLIVNTPSAENWIASIDWDGREEYLETEKVIWRANGQVAGSARTARNLTQVVVLKAGHMAPKDQPEFLLDMVNRFVQNKGWDKE